MLAPVRLADAEVASLLRSGDVVDVVGTDPGSGEVAVVASDARVVSLPAGADPGGGLLGATPSSGGALVVLEVPPAAALELAAAGAAGGLAVVLG
ncbi:hypothetical protein [Desertihabitans brevis]|uniref:hypothetical protein n=1 Tax=Desertihabitans brevis TaxID=2268447 RepID=UPI001F35837A|nr:hypothetical protein [Desertihabitans brevis]